MMKKWIIACTVLLGCTGLTRAGNNETFLNMSLGYMFPRSCTATLALEHELLYQHGVEVFAEYSNGYTPNTFFAIQQVTGGIAYKLPLIRSKNTMLRLRAGIECGSDMDKFVYGPELGFEYAFCLGSKVQMTLQQKNELNIGATRKFRSGFTVGLRIPF